MTKRMLLMALLALALPAVAQDMQPNKDPVPSPSDLPAEQPRPDGDRRTSAIQDPRNAAAGGSAAGQPILQNNRGEPIRPQ